MKNITLMLTMLVITFPALAADKKSTYEKVMKSGKVNCGYGIWPPYINFNFETNKPEGVVVEIMENIAQKINLELEWPEETGWQYMPTALNAGKIDVACATLWNEPQRGRLVAFTDPIFYMAVDAYVREDSEHKFKTIDDINRPDISIIMQDGGYTAAIAKRLFKKTKHIEISQTNASTDILLDVSLGKADVVFANRSTVTDFNKNNKKKLKKVNLPEPVAVYGNAFAVSIHEHALKEVLNTAVRTLIQTGEIEDLTANFREKHPDEILLPSKPYKAQK